LASDLTNISALLSSKFNYQTGPFDGITKNTPAKPFLVKGDYNLNANNKVSFRYNQLSSSTDVNLSNSSSLAFGRQTFSTNLLNHESLIASVVENILPRIQEVRAVPATSMPNTLLIG